MAAFHISKLLPSDTGKGLITAAALTLLTACGGGGGGSDASGGSGGQGGGTPVAPSSHTFSGTAATGAAFAGAVVTVIDASGAVVGTSSQIGADGKYSISISATAKAPFVIVATRTSASGETEKLVSVTGGLSNQTINVTPVTTLIAARLSASGNPEKLAAELASGAITLTAARIQDKAAEIQAVLAPLLSAAGVGTVNPLSDAFNANGSGYDRLLDSLLVSITPASDTATNIEVAVRLQASVGGAAPIAVQFSSSSATLTALPSNATYTLVEEGTAVRITAFLDALTACYALPINQRVSGTVSNGAATGDASAVVAPECKAVFSGSDPANYLNNGARVGRSASNTGAFSGLFRDSATGVKFQQGRYEYSRANGDIVVAYKLTDAQNVETYDYLVVRKDADGKLRAIGNQYSYSGNVTPFQQLRLFPTLNQSAYNYVSTGYALVVNNETEQVNGQTLLKFDRVEVGTPFGTTLTLWPDANYSTLNFKRARDGRISGTNVVRLSASFVNANAAVQSPGSGIEPSLYFASPLFTDDALTNYATQSAWTFKYFLRGNTGTTADAVQTYYVQARALTIGELKQKNFATLNQAFSQEAFSAGPGIPTSGTLAGTLAMYSATEGPQQALIDVKGGGDAWTVPAGAISPTTVTVFGSYAPQSSVMFSFNDSTRVAASARKASVPCTPPVTGGLGQCTDLTSGKYAPGNYLTGLQLSGIAANGRQFATNYATYRLTLPN